MRQFRSILGCLRTAAVAGLALSAPLTGQPVEERYREPGDWLSYDRDNTGRRYAPLTQIDRENVARLAPKWIFQFDPPRRRAEATPLVRDGVMYFTVGGNLAIALDAVTGRVVWRFDYPGGNVRFVDRGLPFHENDPDRGRGLGLWEQYLFFVTLDCHLVALDRRSGGPLWRRAVGPEGQACFGAAGAPILAKGLVLTGGLGGDTGRMRGYLDALDAETGERAWRFHTVPEPGTPGSETWPATDAWQVGGGATWTSGTYDPDLDLVYWPVGNPGPQVFDGRDRAGDNLYTASLLALRPATGKLAWHFQFMPHDLHDWDANQTPVLVDADWEGRPRKLLLQANRNGFYYVLDRETGDFLLGAPFAKQNWWAGFSASGRPERKPEAVPSPTGAYVCPDIDGGTNWQSPAFHPSTELLYVVARDACGLFYPDRHKTDHREPGAQHFLRAIALRTGAVQWEIPLVVTEDREVTFAGALATAGNLVFFGSRDGDFMAADAATGELLWHFYTGGPIRASPMTYEADGRQFVTITTQGGVFAFGLPD